jgi:signal transduction histidine kinase
MMWSRRRLALNVVSALLVAVGLWVFSSLPSLIGTPWADAVTAVAGQWANFGLATLIPGFFSPGFVIGLLAGPLQFLMGLNTLLYPGPTLAILIVALIQAVAISRLLRAKVVVRQTLIYSILVGFITAGYLVLVLMLEKWFQGVLGYRSPFMTVFVAFLTALFFNPVRSRVQMFLVDRALFKGTPAELAAQREQLLAEVRKGAQQKAVATLAAGLAHEIKNPLASIKTFTDYLDTRYDDPAFRAKFRKIVGGEVERINLIVQQLLEFAKPLPPKLTPVDVPQLMDETLDLLNSELVQRHVHVVRRYEGHEQVLGDPQQLKQVFLNLLLNSLQAINGDGRLELRTAVDREHLLVTIADNGQGIARKDLPHLFEPFFTTKPTGTGLGLAVVQSIVKEHGGRITVESHPGQGTSFRLRLPIAV